MKTIVVNLWGGQSSGKSSTMGDLFGKLKWAGINCEQSPEFAKELAWEGRTGTFEDEMYIFGKQSHRLFRCDKKVDVIITDRPLLMSVVYNNYYGNFGDENWKKCYNDLIFSTYLQYDNVNIYLNRVKGFNPKGRREDEETAKEFDILFKKFLDDTNIPYYTFDGKEESVPFIKELILKKLSERQLND